MLQDCEVVVTLAPGTGEATVAWLQAKLRSLSGLNLNTRTLTLSRYPHSHPHTL